MDQSAGTPLPVPHPRQGSPPQQRPVLPTELLHHLLQHHSHCTPHPPTIQHHLLLPEQRHRHPTALSPQRHPPPPVLPCLHPPPGLLGLVGSLPLRPIGCLIILKYLLPNFKFNLLQVSFHYPLLHLPFERSLPLHTLPLSGPLPAHPILLPPPLDPPPRHIPPLPPRALHRPLLLLLLQVHPPPHFLQNLTHFGKPPHPLAEVPSLDLLSLVQTEPPLGCGFVPKIESDLISVRETGLGRSSLARVLFCILPRGFPRLLQHCLLNS